MKTGINISRSQHLQRSFKRQKSFTTVTFLFLPDDPDNFILPSTKGAWIPEPEHSAAANLPPNSLNGPAMSSGTGAFSER